MKSNPNHVPAGSPEGGQFTSGPGGSGSTSKPPSLAVSISDRDKPSSDLKARVPMKRVRDKLAEIRHDTGIYVSLGADEDTGKYAELNEGNMLALDGVKDGLMLLKSEQPEVMAKLQRQGVSIMVTKVKGDTFTRASALVGDVNMAAYGGPVIRINTGSSVTPALDPDWSLSSGEYHDALASSGQAAAIRASYRATIIHEVGHIVDHVSERSLSTSIMNEAVNRLGSGRGYPAVEVADYISKYANKNQRELFAEAFTKVVLGGKLPAELSASEATIRMIGKPFVPMISTEHHKSALVFDPDAAVLGPYVPGGVLAYSSDWGAPGSHEPWRPGA